MKVFRCTHVSKQIEKTSFSDGPIGEYDEPIDQPCAIDAATLGELIEKLGERYNLYIDEVFVNKAVPSVFEFHRLENWKFLQPTGNQMQQFESGAIDLWQSYWQFKIRVVDTRLLDENSWATVATTHPQIVIRD
jgi:hypothetical protein